jgi:putative ABC transport system permease protein
MLDALATDLIRALKRIGRSPRFAVTVVLFLAVGIGTDLTMLALVDSLLFQPPSGVHDIDGLVDVRLRTYPDYADLRDQNRVFSAVAAWYAPPRPYAISGGDHIVPVHALLASASLFAVLGVQPALGRFFTPSEDRPDGPHVAVIGYGLWRRQYGSSASVVGQTLSVAGDLYTIVGVAPKGFSGVSLQETDLILPITTTKFDAGRAALDSRNYFWLHVVARLAPGESVSQAQADATLIYTRGNPSDNGSREAAVLGGRPGEVQSIMRMRREAATKGIPVALWLAAVATAVLLITCANVGGLMLARAVRNRHEAALRSALGATPARLAWGFFLEGGILALAGGSAGLVASLQGNSILQRLAFSDLALTAPLDLRLVVLAVVVTLIAALILGVWPALVSVGRALHGQIAGSPRAISSPHVRARKLLVIIQQSLATVLVVGAILFVASLRNARVFELGMSLNSVLVSDLSLAGAGYSPERARAEIDPIVSALSSIRGVRSVALSDASIVPGSITFPLSVPGLDSVPRIRALRGREHFSAVSPGFFETIGTQILQGRGFRPSDRDSRVAIVSNSFARAYWPGQTPIDRCVKVGGNSAPCLDVVGVAHDRYVMPGDTSAVVEVFVLLGSPGEPPQLATLFPLGSVVLRVDDDDSRISVEAQRVLRQMLPEVPSIYVRPALSLYDRVVRQWRVGASLFTLFGAIAVIMAAIGVYGVTEHAVAARQRELAIRVALGASTRDVAGLILGDWARVTAVGLVLGLGGAAVVARLLRTFLLGISPLDPGVYAGAAAVLAVASLAAAIVPLPHAVGTDPTVTLRTE